MNFSAQLLSLEQNPHILFSVPSPMKQHLVPSRFSALKLIRPKRSLHLCLGLLLLFGVNLPLGASARESYLAQSNNRPVDLVGDIRKVQANHEDTLLDIARRNGAGYWDMVRANPDVDPWLPGKGTLVVVPSRHILPRTARDGLVINIPELRLYQYYRDGQGRQWVRSYPISVGRSDWKTPVGTTRIVAKRENPAWTPTESVRKEHAARGDILPRVVPAGPDNPLGRYAMNLGFESYLIHGTNRPFGIGMQVTHGCMRLYPEDIEELFKSTAVSTPVHLVNEPVKLGWSSNSLFLEVHLNEEQKMDRKLYYSLIDQTLKLLQQTLGDIPPGMDLSRVKAVVEQANGLPRLIWTRPTT